MPTDPTRPSRTARAIALARAIGVRGLHDPIVAQLLPDADRRLAARLRAAVERGGPAEMAVHAATLGLTGHAALRMHAVDRAVDAAVATAAQVVVVGAGFDTRAWRLDGLADAAVLEIDLPALQRAKQARLDLPPFARSVDFVPADLGADDLAAVLAGAGHRTGDATVWIWEAVAPYLSPWAVAATLDVLAGRSAAGSTLVMTFADVDGAVPAAIRSVAVPAIRAGFAALGEPLLTTSTDAEMTAALRSAGYGDVSITHPADWASSAGVDAPTSPFGAEHLAVARRAPA